MNTYIVRVYRREKDNPSVLVGLVEKPGTRGKEAFRTLDDLWAILAEAKNKKKKRNDLEATQSR